MIFNDVRRNQNEEKYEGKVITLTAKIESMEIGSSVERGGRVTSAGV